MRGGLTYAYGITSPDICNELAQCSSAVLPHVRYEIRTVQGPEGLLHPTEFGDKGLAIHLCQVGRQDYIHPLKD